MNSSNVFTEVMFLDLAQQLPSAPRLLSELGRLVRKPETDAAEVVALLKRDAGLVSRLLRMANSAAYARVEPIGSIEEAVMAVGFTEVHRLVGALASVQMTDHPLERLGVVPARLRGNALFTATLMEEFGRRAELDCHGCYTAGLLRTLGKVVLERAAEREAAHIVPFASSGETSVALWERKQWGFDSAQVTAMVLRHWQMPEEIVTAIEFYENPLGQTAPAVHLLRLAVAVVGRDGYGLPGEELRVEPETLAAAGLDEAKFANAVAHAEETFKRLRASIV